MLAAAQAAPPAHTRRAVVRYESEPRVMQQQPEQRGVGSGERGRAEALVAPLVALVAFALYALTASPALGWLDAPEFAAAAASLGVSHSPGHPLVALVGRLATLIPIGDMLFRVSLASAAAGALAAGCLAWTGQALLAHVAPSIPTAARALAAGACGLVYALSWSAWFQSVRPEVYALESLLHGAVLLCALRLLGATERGTRGTRGDARLLYGAGLGAGLALSTHHFIALSATVPLVLAVLWWCRPGLRQSARVLALVLTGLAAFLYLPVRAARDPLVNWGDPDTLGRLWWTLSGQAFHKSTTAAHASSPAQDAAQIVAALGTEATWVLAALALIGLYASARQAGPARRIGVALAGMLGLSALGRVVLGFSPQIGDDHGYLLPGLAALTLLGLMGLGLLAQALADSASSDERAPGGVTDDTGSARRARRAQVAGWLLALTPLALTPWQLARVWPEANLADARASDAVGAWQLDSLPPQSLLLSAYYETRFQLWALQTIDGARPDVTILDRSLLTYPGMEAAARRAHPELAALIDAPLRAGSPAPVEALRALAESRPVRVELHLNLEHHADPWLLPDGAFAALTPTAPREPERSAAEARDLAARVALGDRIAASGGASSAELMRIKSALLWHDMNRLAFFCRQGRTRAAQQRFALASALAPSDRALSALGARCGLGQPPDHAGAR
ncbi:MAG: hypothetical protein Tsb0020_03180 [Haliangiales bacterium]